MYSYNPQPLNLCIPQHYGGHLQYTTEELQNVESLSISQPAVYQANSAHHSQVQRYIILSCSTNQHMKVWTNHSLCSTSNQCMYSDNPQLFQHIPELVYVCQANWAFMVDIFWFLLPIRKLPYTGLLNKDMLVLHNSQQRREQTSTSKTDMEYVNESVLLTVYQYC